MQNIDSSARTRFEVGTNAELHSSAPIMPNLMLGVVNSKQMNAQEIIDMINALSKVVEANKGWLGSESTAYEANKKIKQLMKLVV
jgi:hypothetical protein